MHLALYVSESGIHHGGWRHPAAAVVDPFDWTYYRDLAARAEAACLDMLFIADKLAIDDLYGGTFDATVAYRANARPEPITLLAALGAATTRIGLGATLSTTYSEPLQAARMFASMDHMTGGRIAWNAVTSVSDGEARNFSRTEHLDHATRYQRAAEYLEVVRKLWDSWEEDAIRPDKASGLYADPAKVHYVDHSGPWFQVRGPLNVARPPQGHPVLIQAGASGAFQDLAAQRAEVIFAVQPTIESAKTSYREFKAKVAAAGRDPAGVKVLPGVMAVVGRTDEEAHALEAELRDLIMPVAGLSFMSGSMNYDLSVHPVDGPVPDIREQIRGSKGRFHYVIGKAIEEGWSLTELGRWYASSLSFNMMVGSPATIADEMERWVKEEACDGFVLMPPYMTRGIDDFLEQVVPELQRRGSFRRGYTGATLREHLGLGKPANQYMAEPPSTPSL
jgi:FMN-dependent oxidoreductase (nitrilotriacetate monooxygenase family)